MNNFEVRRRRDQRDENDGEEEAADINEVLQDDRPVFDIGEGQVIMVACGALVFFAVVAIFAVLIFTLAANNDNGGGGGGVEQEVPLPTCFGGIRVPESFQLASTCSSTVQGVCSAEPGICRGSVVLEDVDKGVDEMTVVFECQSATCTDAAAPCTCQGFDGNPTNQACVRELQNSQGVNFLCRDERQCAELDGSVGAPIVQDCLLGTAIFGRCDEFEAEVCNYKITLQDGVTVEDRTCFSANCAADGNAPCQCLDVACRRDLDSTPVFIECP